MRSSFLGVRASGWSLARIASDRRDEASFVVLGPASPYTHEPGSGTSTPAHSQLTEMRAAVDAILPATQRELSRLTSKVTDLGASVQSALTRLDASGKSAVNADDQQLRAKRHALRQRSEALAARAELLVPGISGKEAVSRAGQKDGS